MRKEPGFEFRSLAFLHSLDNTTISVTFHVNNRVQHYECPPGETVMASFSLFFKGYFFWLSLPLLDSDSVEADREQRSSVGTEPATVGHVAMWHVL